MIRSRRNLGVIALVATLSSPAWAQQPTDSQTQEHGPQGSGGQHVMAAGHDAGIMTGVHEMFMGHEQLTRSVTVLPDGIKTVTESADPRLAQLIKDHVTVSNAQVARGVDPGLPMESDALREIFKYHEEIRTTVEPTAAGIVVTQTSSNPAAVAALQQHAAEVTLFVKDGMAAMHAAMMKKRGR
jgi:hypothetical protein